MRIVTGIAKNKPIKTLDGDGVRPTSSRVKEAMFSTIQFDIAGRRVLDLFAGSGQLGLEAMSRGAASCLFVDESHASLEVVRANIKNTGLTHNTRAVNMDAITFLRECREKFNLVFIDPPYKAGLIEPVMEKIDSVCDDGAIVICEHASDIVISEDMCGLDLYRKKEYGITSVTIFKKGGLQVG